MQPQKFIAPNMKDALRQVREALGDDAVILRSERVKPAGVMSFVKQDMVEITAAPNGFSPELNTTGPGFAESMDTATRHMPQLPSSGASGEDLDRLRREISRLNSEIGEIGKYFKYNNLPIMPRELTMAWEELGKTGMDRQWATDITQDALVSLGPTELVSADHIEQFVLDQIAATVRPAPVVKVRRKTPYKVMLVGLPGAGKTTLLQKLVSDPAAFAKRRIGLISLDTHRVAAIEQLRAFSRLSGVPLEIVYRPDQMQQAVQRLGSPEIILVDSAGTSPRDQTRLHELRAMIESLDPDEIHHVINSMIRNEEMQSACAAYREVGVSHLSFTRLDESQRMGYLLNVARFAEKPVGWLTHGQGFTGCLERFSAAHLRQWTRHNEPAEIEATHLMMRVE
jgi:flagellar biosynthesis protein FlhF